VHDLARSLYPDAPKPPEALSATDLFLHNAAIVLAPWLLAISGWKNTRTSHQLATTTIVVIAAVQILTIGLGIGAWPQIIGLLAHLPIELAALAAGIQSYATTQAGGPQFASAPWAAAGLLLVAIAAQIEAGQLPG